MSNVLLLKISPPMQSWGVSDKFTVFRKTNRYPTKSGVIGMIASSLGWDRDHDLSRLASLRMGVRIDSKGSMEYDYQTARAVGDKNSKLSKKYYLEDAVFIVGLESDDIEWLHEIMDALNDPVYTIFAGRKSYPLNPDMVMGIKTGESIESAFSSLPWEGSGHSQRKVETIIDSTDTDSNALINDYPVSYAFGNRKWTSRPVRCDWIEFNNENNVDTMNDAFMSLGKELS